MLKFIRSSHGLLLLPILLLGACQHATESETAPTGPAVLSAAATQQALAGTVSFRNHLKPVLESRCLPCHNGKTVIGLFELTSREKAFQAGPLGPRIIPGKPDKSLLFLNPSGTHKAVQVMPPVGNRLTPEELKIMQRWIAQGAEWPAGSAGNLMNPP